MTIPTPDTPDPIPDRPADQQIGATLDERLTGAQSDHDEALADLRAVMTDEEVRDQFGIDLDKFD